MLVESAIKNISANSDSIDLDSIDWLDLTWLECRRRFAQKFTRSGRGVRILLRLGQTLKHGDLLGHWSEGTAVIVNLLPADVLVIHCQSPSQALAVAFQIGNLHLPIQIIGDEILVPDRSETAAALTKLNIPIQPQSRQFQPTHWPDLVQLSDDFQVVRSTARPQNNASVSPPP